MTTNAIPSSESRRASEEMYMKFNAIWIMEKTWKSWKTAMENERQVARKPISTNTGLVARPKILDRPSLTPGQRAARFKERMKGRESPIVSLEEENI